MDGLTVGGPMATRSTARTVLIILIVIALALVGILVLPFASSLVLAAVLAGALHPLYRRLARSLGRRRTLAAAVFTAGVFLAVVLPVSGMVAVVVNESIDGVRYLRTTLASEGVQGVVQDLPGPLQGLGKRVVDWLPDDGQTLPATTGAQGAAGAAAAGNVLVATGRTVISTVLMLIAFFFLLLDGTALVAWLEQVMPLQPGQVAELLEDFRRVAVSVLVSSLATAGVQSAVALGGYLMAGVPHPFFFALVTFFTAFIPALGGAAPGIALSVLLFLTSRPAAATFLLVWALVVVGLVDNIVKPWLLRGQIEIHGAVIFFALLGGIAVFGAIGLVAGPLVVAFFLATVRLYQRDFGVDAVGLSGGGSECP